MLLFVVPITYFLLHLLEQRKEHINQKAKIWLIPITLLASTYFLFDNSFFRNMNIGAILAMTIFMILEFLGEEIKFNLGLIGKIIEMFLVPLNFISDTFRKLRQILEIKFNIHTINIDYEKRAEVKKIVKSVFITILVVWIIVALLSSADEIFGSIFVKLFEILQTGLGQILLQNVIARLILTLGVFIYLACFFDYISSRYEKEEIENPRTEEKEQFTMCLLIPYKNVSFS